MGGKVYAVRVGRHTGIFHDWSEVKPLVEGYPGAQHKSFKSHHEAEAYLAAGPAPTRGMKRTREDEENDGGYRTQAHRRTSESSLPSRPSYQRRDEAPSYRRSDPLPSRAPAPPVYVTSGVLIVERPQAPPVRPSGGSGYSLSGRSDFGARSGSGGYGRGGGPFHTVVEGPLQPIQSSLAYDLEFDGASRGNPGKGGCGAVLRRSDNKTVVCRLRKYMGGQTTNNMAEYTALIEGLQMARNLGVTRINALGDSKLVVDQVVGRNQIHKDHLRELHGQVLWEAEHLREFSIRHIRREYNVEADRLSNDAIDLAYR